MVWVYYSAQIVLFGAEFTHAFAQSCGSQAAGRAKVAAVQPREPVHAG
jgi:uncharacterized BrkB/YihY/UPF0761 family membrane protein